MFTIDQILSSLNIQALLIEDFSTIFYLTGCSVSSGVVLVFPDEIILFVDHRYWNEVSEKNPHKTLLLSQENINLSLKELSLEGIRIGFDATKLTVAGYEKYHQQFTDANLSFEMIACDRPLKEMRLIKSAQEVATMKIAAKIAWEGFLYAASLLKEGITEKEIALAFEIFAREKGAEELSFNPIIAFGKNAAIPHHESDDTKLKKDQIVLMDLGIVYHGYCSDMTRTVFFGKKHPKLFEIYQIVYETQKEVLKHCRPGISIGELDQIARACFKERQVEELYLHSLGHGIGIDVHEFPRVRFDADEKDLTLEEGMCITIEPGLYIKALGGVRYEDTILITSNGYENFYPEHLN